MSTPSYQFLENMVHISPLSSNDIRKIAMVKTVKMAENFRIGIIQNFATSINERCFMQQLYITVTSQFRQFTVRQFSSGTLPQQTIRRGTIFRNGQFAVVQFSSTDNSPWYKYAVENSSSSYSLPQWAICCRHTFCFKKLKH